MDYLKTYESYSNKFNRWFGDSKMVNGNGTPKVFYHGVGKNGKFTSFRKDTIGTTSGNHGHFGKGFYFTDTKNSAKSFSTMYGGTGEVIEAYLKIVNPFNVTEDNLIDIGEKYNLNLPDKVDIKIDLNSLLSELKKKDPIAYDLLKLIDENGYSKGWELFILKYDRISESTLGVDLNTVSDWYEDTHGERYGNGVSSYTIDELKDIGITPNIIRDYEENIRLDYLTDLGSDSNEWTRSIQKEVYDGIISGGEYVVFEPNQIKSIDNDGEYSTNGLAMKRCQLKRTNF